MTGEVTTVSWAIVWPVSTLYELTRANQRQFDCRHQGRANRFKGINFIARRVQPQLSCLNACLVQSQYEQTFLFFHAWILVLDSLTYLVLVPIRRVLVPKEALVQPRLVRAQRRLVQVRPKLVQARPKLEQRRQLVRRRRKLVRRGAPQT